MRRSSTCLPRPHLARHTGKLVELAMCRSSPPRRAVMLAHTTASVLTSPTPNYANNAVCRVLLHCRAPQILMLGAGTAIQFAGLPSFPGGPRPQWSATLVGLATAIQPPPNSLPRRTLRMQRGRECLGRLITGATQPWTLGPATTFAKNVLLSYGPNDGARAFLPVCQRSILTKHKSVSHIVNSHHPTKPVDDGAQRFQNRTCGRLPQHGHKLTVPCTTSSMARRSAMLGERGAWVLADQFKTTNVARTIGRQSRTTGQYGPASSTDGHKDELVIATQQYMANSKSLESLDAFPKPR